MKWDASILSNNMFCKFLNVKKAIEWKPEAYLFEIDIEEKHNFGGLTLEGNFPKIHNYVLFCSS